jgi:hypothetical protein
VWLAAQELQPRELAGVVDRGGVRLHQAPDDADDLVG